MDYVLQTSDQLGDHLRALRKAKGLTQRQLAVLLEVDQARISDIEKDPGAVNVAQFFRLLTALGAQAVLRIPPAPQPLKRPPAGMDW
jgi:HTH-type transcriptional regulator / antitoxin HipB